MCGSVNSGPVDPETGSNQIIIYGKPAIIKRCSAGTGEKNCFG